MTEQQWLNSDSPTEMYTFICDRVTERQQRHFVEACVANVGEGRSNILREIIGNPFHRYQFENEFLTRHDLLDAGIGKYLVSYVVAPGLLTWNNATIPHIVSEILEEQCDKDCQEVMKKRRVWVLDGPNSHWELCNCNNGFVPRTDPQWSLVPLLADALEEAGCTERTILEHLRGQVVCAVCNGGDNRKKCRFLPGGNPECFEGYDLSKKAQHVKGCWVLELLGGEK